VDCGSLGSTPRRCGTSSSTSSCSSSNFILRVSAGWRVGQTRAFRNLPSYFVIVKIEYDYLQYGCIWRPMDERKFAGGGALTTATSIPR
jgi:hypothetical protein